MISVLLTTQHDWRKPRGINATLGFPPKSNHKRQVASILEALGDDSWLLQTLIEIRHLPIVARGGNSWDLIVLISSLLPVLQAHLLLVFQRTGTVDHTPVYPREVIKRALMLNASALILIHNHPSGDPTPSEADLSMTKEIQKGCKYLGLTLHDHIIVGVGREVSLRARGEI